MTLRLIAAAWLVAVPPFALATPAVARNAPALGEAELRGYGEWVAKAIAITNANQAAFERIAPRLRVLQQGIRDRASAKTAMDELAPLVGSVRPELVRGQAALEALTPIAEPADSRFPFPTRQLRSDLIATGARTLKVLDVTLALVDAMGRDDRQAAARYAGELQQVTSQLIDGQIVMVRARRAVVSPVESTYQALSLMETLYQGMSVTFRQRMLPGPWPKDQYTKLANQAEMLSRTGEAALQGELAASKKRPASSAEDRRLAAMETQLLELERETFAIGRSLAGTLRSLAATDNAGAAAGFRELSALETRLAEVTQRQMQLMSGND